ncbi:MAG TPA: Ig-like domain-containing protein [Xanthomonadaceae bacterium]|jgi:hypothetical protein
MPSRAWFDRALVARGVAARVLVCSALSAAIAQAAHAPASDPMLLHPDHYEFSASLHAPFHPDAKGSYAFDLWFDYPGAGSSTLAAWQVDVEDVGGKSVRRWIGEMPVPHQHSHALLAWDGRDNAGNKVDPGFYTVRLRAVPNVLDAADAKTALFDRVRNAFALFGSEEENQRQDVMVGKLAAPKMPAFHALAIGAKGEAQALHGAHRQSVPATGSLPYTVYYGNLHSQTNHSDGAGPIATCKGEQNPQSGQYGPPDAYAMMQNQAHGDFLMTSEHNHMFDGSTSTNTSANPATAKALFASGLTDMANYNSAHAGFLALYGVEWGVISNGGHMNIFNADGLPEWEYNSSNQLIGDYYTPKSDYAGIYSTMKTHGWIGQFNHPSTSQFAIGGTAMAYDANGDAVMVTAEVLNSSAFSTNTTQSESSRNLYQDAWNLLLERGYHVAPTTDQDNHCSNWGLSYHNRSAVLLPTGTPLNVANFLDALRARRVFAAEDDTGQLILTANGQVMGQTINNSGALTLTANYASSSGQTASRVQFFTGVPGSNGTVTQLYEGSGTTTTTPSVGAHFYYVQVTQANGDRLWSAPIWINEVSGGGDTTPPTVSASESGSSGTITLSATASDNVGVARVEFYVDGVLKSTDTTSPYSATLDSTTLANGSHTLTAKAYDAANNVGTSTAVSFSVNNGGSGDTTPPTASVSESGSSGTITLSATASDNVGVTKVEFYIDGTLKGSDATSPYSMTLDSTTLANGSHTLTAKAYDAANNVGTSTGVSFTISNTTSTQFNEVESNNTIATANAVSRSYKTIVGTMSATTDKDYFGLALNAGDTLKVAMTGPSGTNFNLNLYSASGQTLTSSSGSTSTENISYTSASAQTVYPEVVSKSGTGSYTLTPTYTAGSGGGAELVVNGGFESGTTPWTASTSVIDNSPGEPPHAGNYKAWLDGYGSAHTDTLSQTVAIPATATSATLTFWLLVDSDETSTTKVYDTLAVQVRNSSNAVLSTLHTYSNLDKGSAYVQRSFDLSAYKGQTVKIYFSGVEDAQDATSFLVDDVSLKTQ